MQLIIRGKCIRSTNYINCAQHVIVRHLLQLQYSKWIAFATKTAFVHRLLRAVLFKHAMHTLPMASVRWSRWCETWMDKKRKPIGAIDLLPVPFTTRLLRLHRLKLITNQPLLLLFLILLQRCSCPLLSSASVSDIWILLIYRCVNTKRTDMHSFCSAKQRTFHEKAPRDAWMRTWATPRDVRNKK